MKSADKIVQFIAKYVANTSRIGNSVLVYIKVENIEKHFPIALSLSNIYLIQCHRNQDMPSGHLRGDRWQSVDLSVKHSALAAIYARRSWETRWLRHY